MTSRSSGHCHPLGSAIPPQLMRPVGSADPHPSEMDLQARRQPLPESRISGWLCPECAGRQGQTGPEGTETQPGAAGAETLSSRPEEPLASLRLPRCRGITGRVAFVWAQQTNDPEPGANCVVPTPSLSRAMFCFLRRVNLHKVSDILLDTASSGHVEQGVRAP